MSGPRLGARQLRQDLATALRRAAAGEQVVITTGGRPTAVLGPLHDNSSEATVDALIAAGALVPPRRRQQPQARAPIVVWSGMRLDRAFREVRG